MPRISEFQKAERRRIAVDLDARGLSGAEIAKEMGVSASTVSRILKEAADIAFSQSTRVPSTHDTMLRYQWMIFDEALEAWEKSKDHKRTEKVKTQRDAAGVPTQVTDEISEVWRDGNPAYLRTALSALNQIAEIMGFRRTGEQNILIQAQIGWIAEKAEAKRLLEGGDDFDYQDYFEYLDEMAKLGIIQGPGEMVIEGELVDDGS